MTKVSPEEIKASRHMQALVRWGHVMMCVSNADHYLHKMETLKIARTLDNVLEIDGLLLAFTVTYGRLFTDAAEEFPRLNRNSVYSTEGLRATHDRIMEIRNKRYAHEGDGRDIEFSMEVELRKGILRVKPTIAFGIPGNEFQDFRTLIDVLQAYTYEKIHKVIEKGSQALGVRIEFPHGPPPAHRLKSANPASA
ncbi:hypothetical protein [Mesorhizobium sp. M0058]|uniref:hypothetical protein n=1 Tax=Mesorhizobium sp. M0058 TaxID=2956865 RepID=UPI003334F077